MGVVLADQRSQITKMARAQKTAKKRYIRVRDLSILNGAQKIPDNIFESKNFIIVCFQEACGAAHSDHENG
jgi:hypothetical protein